MFTEVPFNWHSSLSERCRFGRERQKWEDVALGRRSLENEFDSLIQPVLQLGRVICYKLEASGVRKDEVPHKAGEFLKSDLLMQTHFVRIFIEPLRVPGHESSAATKKMRTSASLGGPGGL
jgi:hypothetical protein